MFDTFLTVLALVGIGLIMSPVLLVTLVLLMLPVRGHERGDTAPRNGDRAGNPVYA